MNFKDLIQKHIDFQIQTKPLKNSLAFYKLNFRDKRKNSRNIQCNDNRINEVIVRPMFQFLKLSIAKNVQQKF